MFFLTRLTVTILFRVTHSGICKRCSDFTSRFWRTGPYNSTTAHATKVEIEVPTADLRTGRQEGCLWCQFIMHEVEGFPELESLDNTVFLKLDAGLNVSNVRDKWYHSLHISTADYYLYTSECDSSPGAPPHRCDPRSQFIH